MIEIADRGSMNAHPTPNLQDNDDEIFRRDRCFGDTCLWPPMWMPEQDGREQFYREMLECTADGVYRLDSNGYVTFVNPAARRMTGWSIEDLRGRTQHSMVHHSHADGSVYPQEACPIYAALRDGMVHRRDDEVFWRKDGTSFPVTYTSAPIFRDGKPAGAVIVFRERRETVR